MLWYILYTESTDKITILQILACKWLWCSNFKGISDTKRKIILCRLLFVKYLSMEWICASSRCWHIKRSYLSRICSGYARLFVLSDAHYNPHLFAYIYLKKVWLPKIFDVLELVLSDSEIHVSDIETQGALI